MDEFQSVRSAATFGVAALAMLACPLTLAEDVGWYVGANIGQSEAKIDDERIRSGLLSQGFDTTSISEDDRELGFKLFGGYQFNRYLALEGGYFDLGKFSFRATTLPAGTLSGDIKLKGVNLDVVGLLPFTDRLSAIGRAGANYAEAKDSFATTGGIDVLDSSPGKKDTNYKFGLGLQYALTDNWGVRGEVERYRVNDAVGNDGDVDLFSIGMLYRFGQATPAAASAVTPSPPIAAAAPVVVVVPVAAQTAQYCTILDFQFEIGQDEIQLEEKEKLGVVGTFLQKYPETTAVIEGHTDDVGTAEANMALSQRRADSVVSYLVETFRLAPARLKAVGYGEARPVGDNGTEEGKRMNRRIGAVIACAEDVEGLKVSPARMTMALQMEFDTNGADVRPEYRDQLRRVADFLKANPQATARVEGHTGNLQATAALAEEISQRRAQNVVDYLVDNFGIARSRLAAEGFGGSRRTAYNTTLEGQQENRRVNVIISYPR